MDGAVDNEGADDGGVNLDGDVDATSVGRTDVVIGDEDVIRSLESSRGDKGTGKVA